MTLWPRPSVENLVSVLRDTGKQHSSEINFARLAAGQPWTTEAALRAEFDRQEQAASLRPVTETGVDE